MRVDEGAELPAVDLGALLAAQAAHAAGAGPVVFELAFARLPVGWGHLVFAGLAPLLEALPREGFGAEALAALEGTGWFRPAFLAWLGEFRFSGDCWAVAEGSPLFAHEPALQLEAPEAEARVVGPLVLGLLGYQTLVASQAARLVEAEGGRPVVDAGGGPGPAGAAALAARAAYLGGCEATVHLGAGQRFGVPLAAPGQEALTAPVAQLALREAAGLVALWGPAAPLGGRKQVYRFVDEHGQAHRDVVARREEELSGEPLLRQVMARGVPLAAGLRPLASLRARGARARSRLPATPYLVEHSSSLHPASSREAGPALSP